MAAGEVLTRAATRTTEQARRMCGVLSGMSLPITVGAEAVGTVCLTGDPEEVRRFGLVVRRQTEILLEEAALLRSRLLHERAVDDCVRDVALYDPEVVDAETVEARMAELGADPRIPRTAVVLDVRAARGVTAVAAADRAGGVRRRPGRGGRTGRRAIRGAAGGHRGTPRAVRGARRASR